LISFNFKIKDIMRYSVDIIDNNCDPIELIKNEQSYSSNSLPINRNAYSNNQILTPYRIAGRPTTNKDEAMFKFLIIHITVHQFLFDSNMIHRTI
jgi:hypothetical protein